MGNAVVIGHGHRSDCLEGFCLQEGPAYAEAFFNVLRSVTKEDTVQYVLAILDEMVAGESLSCVDLNDEAPS